MGDLFDGYGSTLAPRKTAQGMPAFDEMFGHPASSGDTAEARAAYRELYQALARMTQDELRGRTESLASSYLAQGVTFDFAGEERPFPIDPVPRVIAYDEWAHVEAGVKQRVRALEAFLDDVYGHRYCVSDGLLPAALIASSQHFYRQAAGIQPSNGVRIQVAGIDLIRDEHGEMRVLEDNVRVPSGVSYVISNRRVMAQTLPELFVSMRVRPVGE
ncbi:circularly permuted type 2 ATP-grasp protein, partial [Microbacterium marinilacus]